MQSKYGKFWYLLQRNGVIVGAIQQIDAIIHLIAFYLLIYQYFGWDQIEPVTFLIANLYWIIGIAFFITFKSKLGIEFFFQKDIKNKIRTKVASKYGFSKFNQNNLNNHIDRLNKFKNCFNKNI